MIINGFGGRETPSSTVQRVQLSTSTATMLDPYTNVTRDSLSPQSTAGWVDMTYFTVTTVKLDDYISSGFKSFAIVPTINSVTGGVFTGQNTNSHTKLGVNPWKFEFTPRLLVNAVTNTVQFSTSGTGNITVTGGNQIASKSYISGFPGIIKTNTVAISSTSSGAWTTYNVNNFTQSSASGTTYGCCNTFVYHGRWADGTNSFGLGPLVFGNNSYYQTYYPTTIIGSSDISILVWVRGYCISNSEAVTNTGSSAINIRYYYTGSPATTSPTFSITTTVYGIY